MYALNQKKEYTKLDTEVYGIDCGGGNFWALKPTKEGGIPVLQYCAAKAPLQWKVFEGNLTPRSISVGASGECWALLDEVPYHFKSDGKNKESRNPGSNHRKPCRFHTRNYTNAILSATDVTDKGNLFLQYTASPTVDPIYLPVNGIRANNIATTYYVP